MMKFWLLSNLLRLNYQNKISYYLNIQKDYIK